MTPPSHDGGPQKRRPELIELTEFSTDAREKRFRTEINQKLMNGTERDSNVKCWFWTEEENRILLEAVDKIEKNAHGGVKHGLWAEIAEKLPGRTPKQCRGHYHTTCTRSTTNMKRWSEEEDCKLMDAVQKTEKRAGDRSNWNMIAKQLDGRSATQCRHRYFRISRPPTKTVRWTLEEDRFLEEAVENTQRGTNGRFDWRAIAGQMDGRSAGQCRLRHRTISNRPTLIMKWTAEEDRILMESAANTNKRADGRFNWRTIADQLDGRFAEQCRKRYNTISHRRSRTSKWTPEEDETLRRAAASTKKRADGRYDWITITDHLDGRSAVQCRERYNTLCNRLAQTRKWSPEEDLILKKAAASTKKRTDGRFDWLTIADQMDGRSAVQCRKRYNTLSHRLTATWTPEEDINLKQAAASIMMIADQLDGKSDVQCQERYDTLSSSVASAWTCTAENVISRKRNRKWTPQEDIILSKAIQRTGKSTTGRFDWVTIAKSLPHRSTRQCRGRFKTLHNIL